MNGSVWCSGKFIHMQTHPHLYLPCYSVLQVCSGMVQLAAFPMLLECRRMMEIIVQQHVEDHRLFIPTCRVQGNVYKVTSFYLQTMETRYSGYRMAIQACLGHSLTIFILLAQVLYHYFIVLYCFSLFSKIALIL